jgi:hypothetical protein
MIDPVKLHALADGELSTEESQIIREQLLSCEESSRELSAIHNLKDCVREKSQVFTCETTLAASMKRVAELDRNRSVDSFVTRYAWGISGAFLALIAIGGVFNRNLNANRVQSSEIASTIADLVPTPTRQAPAPTAYDRWLDNLIQQAKVSTDANRIEVRGYAFGELAGRRVVKVALRDVNGDLGLLVIPGNVTIEGMSDGVLNGSNITGMINGMNCVARNQGAQSIVLFGDRSFDQLSATLSRIALRNP